MKKLISCVLCISWLAISAIAATGVSPEFKMDLLGMGPWEMRTAAATEALSYSSTWTTNTLDDAKAVVKVYSVKREKPKYIAIDLSGGTAATHYPIEYLDEIPGGSWSDEYKTTKLVLRHIPAGSFIMGIRATDYPGEVNTNLHMVTLTKDFYMGVFEVTQRQWELVMGNNPSRIVGDMRPVEMVSYVMLRGNGVGVEWPQSNKVDDDSFLAMIRKKTGIVLDLPTVAQWEFACRAGTNTGINNGLNLIDMNKDDNLALLARYRYNEDDGKGGSTYKHTVVGMYLPNAWGLYDMHGNVWEWCLDYIGHDTSGVDPVGPLSGDHRRRKGGSCWNEAYICTSGQGSNSGVMTLLEEFTGFRLCLQGGEIPEIPEVVELVNAFGESTKSWTPTKAGTYYLTHEIQTNGVNGAEVLGAWFTVDAPKLTFVPDGDLTPGVKVAIAGAGEGWTVRYTTDGAAPTSSSLKYTGPITLNDSATIRAVVFSDGGLESLEYSATFSLMSVGGAVAKPRYPWSGKVDIDVTVKGTETEDYLVSLVARDLDGGTNLPLRTAWQAGGTVTNNAFLVKPGVHRFTWDAAADITNDCEFANVVVKVSAEHSAIIAAKKVLTLEVAGYAGAETLTNVPVLVRLSTAIDGFSYADFVDAKGGDLVFTDESGSIVYPHEIDEWHTDGESLVWVKLPQMVNGTKFKMAYGNSKLITLNSQLATHEVWRDYAGVWHMNEDSGTAYDSTANGLDAQPETGTNKTVNIQSEMMAYDVGVVGRARQNEISDVNETKGCGNYLLTPSYDALGLGGQFIVSGWFRAEQVVNYPRMISRKNVSNSKDGWEIHPRESSTTNISIRGATNGSLVCNVPDMNKTWVNVVAIYEPGRFMCYTNGVCGDICSDANAVAPTDNGLGLAFGCNPSGNENTWCGQYDEIRLRGGTLSADRIKADYDMIVNRNFLRYGPVEEGKGAAE